MSTIVPGRREHIPFVAWARLTAERSHVARGPSEIYLNASEVDTLRYLEAVAEASTINPCHYSGFLVAEVGGEPAAALCGFRAGDYDDPAAADEFLRQLNADFGRTHEEHEAGLERVASWDLVHPTHGADAWVMECVATKPDFRRQGLINALISAFLVAGQRKGATVAEVPVYIGNDAAQLSYEKAGFTVVDEKTHPEFEAVFGFPGIRLLRQTL